ncbi:exonuclease [Salmonella phage GEC_vB_N5]|uniref:Exonuclease n=2 Tax=Markadamsvirinae TaxID=2732013 RepID=A0A7S9XF39_9CAUD|nr:exonuclease [Salmonella phage GEC_vB_N3]QPI15146.1 exonuclease [Salmonella phage GEC_vB_N5]
MFNNVFSKEANPILVNFWRTLPANLYNEAINALKIWCENNEISLAFKGEIEEAPCIGLIVQVEDGLEEIVGWKELDEMGLVFALNYKLFMPNKHRIVVNYKTGESPGFQVNERYGWSYSPEEVNDGIQKLRRFGYQIPGLTA